MINPTWPSSDLVAITPSDATVYSPHLRMIYCGSTGNISVTTAEGTTVSFIGVPTGGLLALSLLLKLMQQAQQQRPL
jgi:hypothetical protein